jgi:hypothetical protein
LFEICFAGDATIQRKKLLKHTILNCCWMKVAATPTDYNQAKTAIRMERTGDDLTPTCVLLGLL